MRFGTFCLLLSVSTASGYYAYQWLSQNATSYHAKARTDESGPLEEEANPFVLPAQRKATAAKKPLSLVQLAKSIGQPAVDQDRVTKDINRLAQIYATPEAKALFHAPGHDPHQLATQLRGNTVQLAKLVSTAREFSTVAADCLQQNLCNQTPPEEGFFDPQNTRVHAMLNESLDFLKAAQELDGVKDGMPDSEDLLGNLKIPNPKTQVLSLELLLTNPPSDQLRDRLFAEASSVQNEAKPLYLSMLASISQGSPEAHREYINLVQQSFENDDVHTVAETVKKIDQLKIAENDFPQTVASLCRLKRDPATAHVYDEANVYVTDYYERNSFTTQTPNQICN